MTTQVKTNELSTYKKLHIMTEFILSNNHEDSFVLFLKELQYHPDFIGMNEEITSLINQYEITDTEIQQTMKQLFIV
ncbi:hypothetical protein [Sutcliffiella sp. NC1]|uniref:hypothetical protein n=1 Tax=Sutcliffiella sp. NC1 TaxID=3004096 RepID=UPI0022DD5D01|nr:hypothetical protein [Sutcliffiella sp. NC1]WBL16342.1 hypothetical protein O1A01_06840 [Sutcliffiella sp. NC1]